MLPSGLLPTHFPHKSSSGPIKFAANFASVRFRLAQRKKQMSLRVAAASHCDCDKKTVAATVSLDCTRRAVCVADQ